MLFLKVVRLAWFLLLPETFLGAKALESIPGVRPQLYADNLKCVSGSPAALLSAARFSNMKIRLVGQEAAPKKCVFLSTSKKVRNDMKGWAVSDTGDRWTVGDGGRASWPWVRCFFCLICTRRVSQDPVFFWLAAFL